jgi:hypothetical protein
MLAACQSVSDAKQKSRMPLRHGKRGCDGFRGWRLGHGQPLHCIETGRLLTRDHESLRRIIEAPTEDLRQMMAAFWTAEKDKQLRRLEAAGLSAAQIADRLGTTRSAVIGRPVRLRGLVFPSQLQRQRTERTLQAARLHQQKERTAASLASMRRVITRGTPRDVAIVSAARAHVTYQAIADELGLTKQRVQQIVARSHD